MSPSLLSLKNIPLYLGDGLVPVSTTYLSNYQSAFLKLDLATKGVTMISTCILFLIEVG